jgi:hypothetical protein
LIKGQKLSKLKLDELLHELDYAAEVKIDLTIPHKNCALAAEVIRAALNANQLGESE